MKTKKELLDDRAKLLSVIEDLQDYRKHVPEIGKLEQKIQALRDKYLESVEEKLDKSRSLIAEINSEITAREKSSKVFVPQSLIDRIREAMVGVDYGKWSIVWLSPDSRMIVFKFHGKTGWAGQGMTRYYPTRHCLVDFKRAEAGRMMLTGREVSYLHTVGKLSPTQLRFMVNGANSLIQGKSLPHEMPATVK